MAEDILQELGIDLIPEPQQIIIEEGVFRPGAALVIALPNQADEQDRFAADELAAALKREQGIEATVITQASAGEPTIHLKRREGADLKPEGYRLTVRPTGITLEGNDAAGLFWGTQSILQAFQKGSEIPCMTVQDWPDICYRAIHYDTKHHQGTYEYVEEFIRTLARYKVNMLVWEWEDKFAYERHPEIGAPGAFTKSEMQNLTAFARQYHVQIVPLVQGLGHVSYILKHEQHAHLREIPDSAWEFCPLNDGSYDLLFDLWDEAMEATPGSELLHIGSDETYELGQGEACGCKQKTEEIGKNGLMHIFIHKCVAHVESRGRRAMSWGGAYKPGAEHQPPKKMIFVDSSDVEYLKESQEAGYGVFIYARNPGIEPLFLSYLPWTQHSMWRPDTRRVREGSFWDTAESIANAGKANAVLGSITTSWDDSGLHNQAWMPRFICAAE
jgi:N-acetyl-beta-hexosaminidase